MSREGGMKGGDGPKRLDSSTWSGNFPYYVLAAWNHRATTPTQSL